MILTTYSYCPISIKWFVFITKAVVWKEWTGTQLSHAFEPEPVHARSAVGKMELGQAFPESLVFPCQYHFTKPSPVVRFHLYSTLIILMPLLSGQAGENWDLSDRAKLFRIGEHRPETYLHDVFSVFWGSDSLHVMWNTAQTRTTRTSLTFCTHPQNTPTYILVSSCTLLHTIHTRTYNTQEHTTKTSKRKYSNGWKTRVHTQIHISSRSRTQHRTDLDYRTLTRTKR
jgi:hypothetical protein